MMVPMRGDGEQDTAAPPAQAPPGSGILGWFDALRGLLDRPLASYYLLLSSAGLLVFIGLVMVFSVTGVEATPRPATRSAPVQADDLRRGRARRVLGLPAAAGAHVPRRGRALLIAAFVLGSS